MLDKDIELLDVSIKQNFHELGDTVERWNRIKTALVEAGQTALNKPSAPFYLGCVNDGCGWNTKNNRCGLVVCCPGRR